METQWKFNRNSIEIQRTFFCVSFAFLSCVSFAFALTARAQGTIGIQVNPPIIEVLANPGEIVRETIHVTNRGETDETLILGTRDMKGMTNAGQPVFAEIGEPTGFEMSSWIVFPEKEMLIQRGETKHIPFDIHIPEAASPGGHFAGFFFTREAIRPEKSGAGVGLGVGSILIFRVSGEIVEEARLKSFYTEKAIYQKPEVTFLTRVENEGNVLIHPKGLIEIWDTFGNEVAKVPVNEKGNAVFPRGERVFTEIWKYQKIGIGRYRAIISLVYGEEGRKTMSQATSFWIIPFRDIGIGVGTLLVFLLGIGFGIRFYIQKKLREFRIENQGIRGYHKEKTNIEQKLLEKENKKDKFLGKLIKTTLTMLAVSFVIFLLLLLFA